MQDEQEKNTPSPELPGIPDDSFPIVGIGASAGGMEAIETFFSAMPADVGMAFVIIQHLSPSHKSLMSSLLAKHTSMKVLEAQDGIKIELGCVYINPPDRNIALINGALHFMEMPPARELRLSIDYFFRTLAEDREEKAICIIFSGTGSDGTLGVKAVKEKGGMVMVQKPESAKYDGMPHSAISTGLADYILPPENMPEQLIKYVQHPYIVRTSETEENEFHKSVQKIFVLIRLHTGHDFSHYKITTVRRRIARRMAVHQIDSMVSYIRYLHENPVETELLFKDLLIGVTRFFRHPEAFDMLKESVIPAMLENRAADSEIRVWVPGCSTGEEAYSLAIIFAEVMEMLKKHFEIRIFASDIDPEAIRQARSGQYPDSIAGDISHDRLNQFFTKEGNGYKVKKRIRESVVYSIHNIIKDPPFSKTDMISCRNLMIYIDTALQKKILSLFHYSLNENGVLLLGTSESIGGASDLFSAIDVKWKIYRRNADSESAITDYFRLPLCELPVALRAKGAAAASGADIQSLLEKLVIRDYVLSCVLISGKNYEVLHIIGQTEKYLTLPSGKADFNILKMAREDIRSKLTEMIWQAVRRKQIVRSGNLKFQYHGTLHAVDVEVRPLREPAGLEGTLLVIFDDRAYPEKRVSKKEKTSEHEPPAVAALEQELRFTREHLQVTVEEREASNEELRSTNEEMQSVNEELQSANEELETSKEELQSTNEELTTVNSELRSKVDELSQANSDIGNLFASIEIGTVFLDARLCVRRFTPAVSKIFNLISSDTGRRLSDITSNLLCDTLCNDAKEVLDTLIRREFEIQHKAGNWYAVRILPYRTTENVIDGVVITFTDITETKVAIKAMRRWASVVQNFSGAVIIQDAEGKILGWNKAAEELHGWTEAEALKMNIRELIPEDRQAEARAVIGKLKKGESVKPFETRRLTRDGRLLNVSLKIAPLSGEEFNFAVIEWELP